MGTAKFTVPGAQGAASSGISLSLGGLRWLVRSTLLLGLLLPFVLSTYQQSTVTLALAYIVGVTSLVVLTGYVGQVSLCQVSFMGLGAFLCGALMGNLNLSYWVAAPSPSCSSFWRASSWGCRRCACAG